MPTRGKKETVENHTDLRSTVRELVRDSNISKRHDCVDKYKPEIRSKNHRYFLRNNLQESREEAHVDHILECQFLSHIIMQTECLLPVMKNVEVGSCMKKQPYTVQNVLKPLYRIHNGQDEIASYFNLQLMDGNLNILKGLAVTEFLSRQSSTTHSHKKGPVDFVSQFQESNLVKEGVADADTLAGEADDAKEIYPPLPPLYLLSTSPLTHLYLLSTSSLPPLSTS